MITEEQRERRRSRIGSSDVPALVGVDPYRNIHDLFLEKTGHLADLQSDDCDRGTDLEPAVLDMFERRMNVRVERNIELRNGGIFAANLDGAIIPSGQLVEILGDLVPSKDYRVYAKIDAIVEAKTTVDDEGWGEGLEDVPLRVLVQVQEQMMVAGCGVAYIPVLIPKYKRFHFEIYQVRRHDGLIAEIKELGERFWQNHVLRDIPPPAVLPHVETLRRLKREPASKVLLNGEAQAAWALMESLKAERKLLDEGIDAYYSQILSMLGQAEAGELEDGDMLTYLEQNGQRTCDWALLEMRLREINHPEIFTELVKQGRHRVLRLKKAGKK